jgi:hypothetical protein
MFIKLELGQKVAQNPHIHGCMILMPWALFLSRWVFMFHGHIVVRPQMLYQVVLGYIGCIAPINPTSKFGPILCPMDTFYGNWGRGNHIYKKKKPNVRLNILNEGYPLNNEGIT